MKNLTRYSIFCALILIILAGFSLVEQSSDDDAWKENWGVVSGFAIEKDTEGYFFPSAIAFVPNPGDNPKDPLYFVTELRGAIKVVTNDRTVITFIDNFFSTEPGRGLEVFQDEFGLAGICLDPQHGYIFVTYAFRGGDNKLHNSIARFETTPGTFSTSLSGSKDYKEIFRAFKTDASHQIGGCQVYDGLLFVSVGDGLNEETPPIALESLRGKVLRLTLNGEPAPENPFYREDEPESTVNYVWVTGFRNPFGLEIVNGRVFVADNGRNLDRFLEVQEGEDYLWDGTDWSIGAAADVTFTPSIGPAQLKFYPADSHALPTQFDDTFFIAMTGTVTRGIVNVRYDFSANQVNEIPQVLLRYIGPIENHYDGIVPALGIGPDGLYFAPMLEDGVEIGVVYRIYYDPSHAHPFNTEDINNPKTLLTTLGCTGCHSIDNQGGLLAPPLDYQPLVAGLQERLHSSEYLSSLDELDLLNTEPFVSQREARDAVRQNEGLERIRNWIYFHVLEPKFDHPEAQMPNLGINKDHAQLITNYLVPPGGREIEDFDQDSQNVEVSDPSKSSNPFVKLIAPFIPILGYRHLLVFFAGGLVVGGSLYWLVGWLRAKRAPQK